MKTIYLEIRPAEGGDDSKLLVQEMTDIYKQVCAVENYKINSISVKDSITTFCL